MELLRWKIKLSALWIVVALNAAAYLLIRSLEPGGMMGLNPVTSVQGGQLLITLCFLVYCIMIYLSIILNYTANRWTNLIMGILMIILARVPELRFYWGKSTALQINILWGILAAALIIWYAWKMPREEVQKS